MSKLETIHDATIRYEAWLTQYVRLQHSALQEKHKDMEEALFSFFRATFYRWIQCFYAFCPEEQNVPVVLSVGDLHVENFGTWRDIEGRLVWGINDMDEAAYLPYSHDLIRLATSALVAIKDKEEPLDLDPKEACQQILKGYRKGIESEGSPYILIQEGENAWLEELCAENRKKPEKFYQKLKEDLYSLEEEFLSAYTAIDETLNAPTEEIEYATRNAGKGSLGRPRIIAKIGKKEEAFYREAKALLPSAAFWADPKAHSPEIYYSVVLANAVRSCDSIQSVKGGWIVRTLSPDYFRLKLNKLEKKEGKIADANKLMEAMGYETANIHLGTWEKRKQILENLDSREENWLHETSKKMQEAVERDYADYKGSA